MSKFNLDLTNDDEQTLDNDGRVPPGWYRATVHDVTDDQKNMCTTFEFHVSGGPYAGTRVFDRLNDPEYAKDENGARVSTNRLKLFASRLGLIKKDDIGRQAEVDFMEAIGTDCVIQVKHRPYTGKDGGPKTAIELEFGGIFPPDHEKIPADVRAALGLPGVSAVAAGATTPAKEKPARGSKQRQAAEATVAAQTQQPALDLADL